MWIAEKQPLFRPRINNGTSSYEASEQRKSPLRASHWTYPVARSNWEYFWSLGTGCLSIAGLLQLWLITNLEQFVEKPSMLGKAAIALLLASYPGLSASQFSWINKDEGLRLCKWPQHKRCQPGTNGKEYNHDCALNTARFSIRIFKDNVYS